MKRQQERDTPPKSKRQRLGYGGPEGSDIDCLGTENDRREGRGNRQMGRDKNHRARQDRGRDYDIDSERMPKRHKHDRSIDDPHMSKHRSERLQQSESEYVYRTLCISNFNTQVNDGMVMEALNKEFRKFGEFNLRIDYQGEHRIAYINFKHPEDAQAAKHARGKLILFDRPVRIDTVYNKRERTPSPPPPRLPPDYNIRDGYSNRSSSPGYTGENRPPPRHANMAREGPRGAPNTYKDQEFYNYDNRGASGRQYDQQQRFPHHLDHMLPEDDDKATRTLFVGKLDNEITQEELTDVFSRFGIVEEIDIKRPQFGTNKGPGGAYAFVKFINLDMAHRAKVQMSGEYIGKFQCKIGYGKATPSTCLWIGGLGPWIRTETLEREFDRFGVIHRIEWPQGKDYAYVLYDSLDAAQAACQEMRGFSLGGPDRRIRMDFADVNHIVNPPPDQPPRLQHDDHPDMFMGPPPQGFERDRGGYDNQWRGNNKNFNGNRRGNARKNSWGPNGRANDYGNPDNQRNSEFDRFRKDSGGNRFGDDPPGRKKMNHQMFNDEQTNRSQAKSDRQFDNFSPNQDNRVERNGNNNFKDRSPGGKRRFGGSSENHNQQSNRYHSQQQTGQDGRTQGPQSGLLQLASVEHVDKMSDLAKCLPVVWSGALVLKNSAFAARMHLLSGEVNLVDNLMRDPTTTEMPVLRIMQRLRLDQPKLDEVNKRVLGAGPGGHSILLAMPGSSQALEDSNPNIQQRPLRNLMSYLKQKEAAGVITLPPNPNGKDKDNNHGILYAFPPCPFAQEFLKKRAPKLGDEPCKEDCLVVFVVRCDGPVVHIF